MLRALKSYWAFTNNIYKLVMLVILPIAFIFSNSVFGDVLLESLFILYAVDTLSDIFFLSGFYRKNNGALEFLQSSPRFEGLIRDVAIVDMIRRFVIYQVPFITAFLSAGGDEIRQEWCRTCSCLPLLETLVAQLVVIAARHFVVWHHAYICTAIGYSVILFCWLVFGIFASVPPVVMNGILAVCVICVFVGTVRYTCKKVRESYYDS